jgi:hypothetical protein
MGPEGLWRDPGGLRRAERHSHEATRFLLHGPPRFLSRGKHTRPCYRGLVGALSGARRGVPRYPRCAARGGRGPVTQACPSPDAVRRAVDRSVQWWRIVSSPSPPRAPTPAGQVFERLLLGHLSPAGPRDRSQPSGSLVADGEAQIRLPGRDADLNRAEPYRRIPRHDGEWRRVASENS